MIRNTDTLEPKVGGLVGRTGWVLYLPRGTVYYYVDLFSATWNRAIRSKRNSPREIRTRVILRKSAVAATGPRAPDTDVNAFFNKNIFTNTIS